MVGDVEQNFIDLLKEFQEKGNRDTHSLFNLAHQDFIEEKKEKMFFDLKKPVLYGSFIDIRKASVNFFSFRFENENIIKLYLLYLI